MFEFHVLVLVSFLLLLLQLVWAQASHKHGSHEFKTPINHTHEEQYSVGVMPNVEPPYAVLFIFTTFGLAVSIRCILRALHVPVPSSVVVFIIGGLFGWLSQLFNDVAIYTDVFTLMSPKHLLIIFLPPLIFRKAFELDVHTFVKSLGQITVISFLGFSIAALIIATIMKYVHRYLWSWEISLMFGVIACICYPQEVIVVLQEHGQSKRISILLEGEGLLTTAIAIVAFNMMLGHVTGYISGALQIFLMFLQFVLGGPVMGIAVGWLTGLAMTYIFSDILSNAIITVMIGYVSYYVAEEILGLSGVLCVCVLGVMISLDRMNMSIDVENFLRSFWDIIGFLANAMIFMVAGVVIVKYIIAQIDTHDIIYALIVYLVSIFTRFLVVLLLYPILTNIGYGLTWRTATIIIWGGLRGAVSLCLALVVYNTEGLEEEGEKFLIHISVLVLLSLVINGSTFYLLLKLLGMMDLSLARRANMANAVKYLIATRDRSIALVKMNRFLADANWVAVEEGTRITNPYNLKDKIKQGDDDTSIIGYHLTTCPECEKEVLAEPSSIEYREMEREAWSRVLKAKEVSYVRQYEQGKLSRDGIRILISAVETAGDRKYPIMEVNDLQGCWKEKGMLMWLRKRLMKVLDRSENLPPLQKCKRMCFRIAQSYWFQYFLYFVVTINAIPMFIDLYYTPVPGTTLALTLTILNSIFYSIYLMELIIKFIGLSLRGFFQSCWNVSDFIVLLISTADLIVEYLHMYTDLFIEPRYILMIKILRILNFLRLFRLFRLCLPKVISTLDSQHDRTLEHGFEVGRGFVTGEEDVLKVLDHIIDNKKIKEHIAEKLDADRLQVTQILGLIQKDRPWIAITINTQQAIRTVLNRLVDAINELKQQGLLDDLEYRKLRQMIEDKKKILHKHYRLVRPCPPKILLEEVPWMVGDSAVKHFIIEKSKIVHFNYDDTIFSYGSVPENIYIIITGLVKYFYKPSEQTIQNLRQYGALPNVDYFTTLRFHQRQEEYVVPGNVLGELGLLTGRLYDATVSCVTYVQAFEIAIPDMMAAMNLSPHPRTGLRALLWKVVAIRVAVVILSSVPLYQSWTQENIKYHLDRAFVPKLSQKAIFVVNTLVEDVLLIEGQVMDANSRQVYYAPSYIPRTVEKLIFPKSSMMNVDTPIETKLLIIPIKGADEVDFSGPDSHMKLISSASARCLQHTAQSHISQDESQLQPRRRRGHGKGQSFISFRAQDSRLKDSSFTSMFTNVLYDQRNEEVLNVIETRSEDRLSSNIARPSVTRSVAFGTRVDEKDSKVSAVSLGEQHSKISVLKPALKKAENQGPGPGTQPKKEDDAQESESSSQEDEGPD